jgi:hypothetical protein
MLDPVRERVLEALTSHPTVGTDRPGLRRRGAAHREELLPRISTTGRVALPVFTPTELPTESGDAVRERLIGGQEHAEMVTILSD